MPLNCGVGEDSRESLGLQGNPTSLSWRKLVLNIHWKDWCWSWNSNTLATWCEELTHLQRPWCWERLKEGEEGDSRGQDGWMASLTQWMSLSKLWDLMMDRDAWHASVHGVTETDMTERLTWTELKPHPTLGDSMDCSLPGSSVHKISQARIFEWVAISYSRGSSNIGIKTISPTESKRLFYKSVSFFFFFCSAYRVIKLGKPRGNGWRGRWEGGLGWGTHVNPWLFHFNV